MEVLQCYGDAVVLVCFRKVSEFWKLDIRMEFWLMRKFVFSVNGLIILELSNLKLNIKFNFIFVRPPRLIFYLVAYINTISFGI